MTTIEATRDHCLKLIGNSETAIGFRGNSDNCIRLAEQLGMEAIAYKGACEETESGTMFWNEGSEDNFTYCEFSDGGFMIHDACGFFFLSIPFSTWSKGAKS